MKSSRTLVYSKIIYGVDSCKKLCLGQEKIREENHSFVQSVVMSGGKKTPVLNTANIYYEWKKLYYRNLYFSINQKQSSEDINSQTCVLLTTF